MKGIKHLPRGLESINVVVVVVVVVVVEEVVVVVVLVVVGVGVEEEQEGQCSSDPVHVFLSLCLRSLALKLF